MSFSRYFKLVAIATALMLGYSPAAAKKISTGKIRNASGPQALHEPKGKGGYINAEPNAKVTQKDRFKTGDESLIIIGLPDGSALTINERTEAQMTELLNEDGINHNTVNILNGKVNFDVQKQAKGSDFKFKTGTATAAIRGTAGTIGFTSLMKPIASLSNGSIEVEDSALNTKYSVKGGQTAFSIGNEILVLDLKSSGEAKFLDEIDKFITDPALANNKDALIKLVQKADSSYQVRKESFKQSANCTISPLPDTVFTAKQKVKAKCAKGTLIGIQDKPVLSNGEIVELDVEWASSLIGAKKISLSCYVDSTSYFPCGEITTYYAGEQDTNSQASGHKPLTITTSSPAEICNPASVTVEGFYDTTGTNPSLIVKIGKKFTSQNLIQYSANGKFSYTVQINDVNDLWNENQVDVEYTTKEFGTETAFLPLKVNKRCKSVNQIRPTVTFLSYDSLKCRMNYKIANANEEYNIFTITTDNTTGMESIVSSDIGNAFAPLKKGRHTYTLKIEDQAGNLNQVTKTLGCYPKISGAHIDLSGKEIETLRVPPPPKNYKNTFHKSLRFNVRGLPEDRYEFIKKVTVTQKGKVIEQWRESDVSGTLFETQVELTRGEDAKFEITVYLKSGQKPLKEIKTFKVR